MIGYYLAGNEWLNHKQDNKLLMDAAEADVSRIKWDTERLELNADAAWDAGFEAGVLASEAGLARTEEASAKPPF